MLAGINKVTAAYDPTRFESNGVTKAATGVAQLLLDGTLRQSNKKQDYAAKSVARPSRLW